MGKTFILSSFLLSLFISYDSLAQIVEKTDAEPDYWTNLFSSTIRYTVQIAEPFDVDVYFDRVW